MTTRRGVCLALAMVISGPLVSGLAGCAPPKLPEPPPPPPPTVVELVVVGAPDQNAPPGGGGLPLQVDLYLLRSPVAFQRLGYFQLAAPGAIAADVAQQQSLTVAPGDVQRLRLEVPAGVTQLGAVGQFRAIDQADWRALAPVPKGEVTAMTLRIRRSSLALETAPH